MSKLYHISAPQHEELYPLWYNTHHMNHTPHIYVRTYDIRTTHLPGYIVQMTRHMRQYQRHPMRDTPYIYEQSHESYNLITTRDISYYSSHETSLCGPHVINTNTVWHSTTRTIDATQRETHHMSHICVKQHTYNATQHICGKHITPII